LGAACECSVYHSLTNLAFWVMTRSTQWDFLWYCVASLPSRHSSRVMFPLSLSDVCIMDRLCSLVVRVLGYRSGGPGSIPGTTKKKISGSGTGSTQPREYNWGATW
jgi:hypothetical protein